MNATAMRCFWLGLGLLSISLPVSAQTPASTAGEVIVTSSGAFVAPWKEVRVCGGQGEAACRMVVLNATTKEVARVDGRLATKFVATGNGQEIQRAETAMEKAQRLGGAH